MKLFFKWMLSVGALAALLGSCAWAESSGDARKARCIAGYAAGDAPKWDPMNDEDRQYVGPTLTEPGEWFKQKNEIPAEVGSEKDLKQLIYAMAYNLESSRTIKASCGVTEKLLNKWIRRINTSVYGQGSLSVKDDSMTLQLCYTPESRILAAFRNPSMEARLGGKEKDTFDTCCQWISENISVGMPNGLKLKKIHDALIDNSKYTRGCHSTAEIVLEGKGVCSAYTTAAQLLMHMLKIDCRRIYGTQKMNHVWNYVEIDKEWYHMDVTWDDPTGNTDLRMYNYFLLTDVEMDADHDWVDADLYEPTPKINPWHFPVRNDIRRSWIKAETGYSLPKEDESVEESMYNQNLREAVARGEQFANLMGRDVKRKEKAEDKLKMGKGSDPVDVAKRWSKYAPKLKKYKPEEDEGVKNYREFNEKLVEFVNALEDKKLEVQCKKGMEGWKMRQIIGKSDINVYAEKYNAVINEQKSTITLEIEYWPHVRVLTAANNDSLVGKLTPGERKALAYCRQKVEAMPIGSLKRKRSIIKDLHQELIQYARHTLEPYGISEFASKHESRALGYAQAMYVILNMSDIPCIMVHGRFKKSCCCAHDQAWNLVRLNIREWYHVDAGGDDEKENSGEQNAAYCLRRDDEMKGDHSWDVEEIPATPTKEEKETLKKLNPFNLGR